MPWKEFGAVPVLHPELLWPWIPTEPRRKMKILLSTGPILIMPHLSVFSPVGIMNDGATGTVFGRQL